MVGFNVFEHGMKWELKTLGLLMVKISLLITELVLRFIYARDSIFLFHV